MMFESAFTSGVSTEFWEDGDWALHYTLCATYSDALNSGSLKAFLLDTLLTGWKSLGITVGSRATMRLELRPEEPAGDTSQWEIIRLAFLEKRGKPMTEAEKALLDENRHRLAS